VKSRPSRELCVYSGATVGGQAGQEWDDLSMSHWHECRQFYRKQMNQSRRYNSAAVDYACESMRAKYSDTQFASVSSDFDLNKRIGANEIVNKDATNREVAVG